MDRQIFWLSLGPLIVINGYFIISIICFYFLQNKIQKAGFIEERHHSKILNKWIRHWWIWITTPLFRFFLFLRVTPNQISILGTVLGVLSGLTFAFASPQLSLGAYGLAGWLLIFGGSLDFMDGRVARETGQESLAGAFLDSVLDRISESAVFTGLAYYFRDSSIFWFVMAAYLGAMMTSYAKCRGDKMGAVYEGGMMQRPERIVYTGVGAVFAPLVGIMLLKYFPMNFTDLKGATDFVYAFPLGFVAIMANYTTFNRIHKIMGLLDKKEHQQKN